MKTWIKNMRNRKAEIKMLHVSLGFHLWLPMDVWYLITGRM